MPNLTPLQEGSKKFNVHDAHEVFRHAGFVRYQLGRFLSVLGMQMQSVAVGWQVYALSNRPLDLGLVGLAIFVPFVIFALFAGDIADRFDRRKILAYCYGSLTCCSLFLLIYSAENIQSVWPIYVVSALLGATRAFVGPAGAALLPHLVPEAIFGRAVAWSSSIWQFATIAGPALGGLFYGTSGGSLVYGICAFLMVVSVGLILSLKMVPIPKHEVTTKSWQRLTSGIEFVWKKKIVLGAISLDLFAVLFGGAVALLPIFARDILHTGPLGLGVMRSAPAVGAAVTAVWLAYFPMRSKVGMKMLLSVAVFGIATCIFGLSHNYIVSVLSLVVIGSSDMVSVVVRQTLIQLGTPDAMRGRVSAVNMVFIGASNELGEFESGVTAELMGTVPAVLFGGVGTCLVVAMWWRLFPTLRNVDKMEEGNSAHAGRN
jgi:MFS family permease